MNKRELGTVLAALRQWQAVNVEASEPDQLFITNIATDGGKVSALSSEEIDDLAHNLNTEGDHRAFVVMAARLTMDDENGYEMSIDDAMETLNRLIADARRTLGWGNAPPESEVAPICELKDDACRQCGKATDDGEGWDGLCGNCADVVENTTSAVKRALVTVRGGIATLDCDPGVTGIAIDFDVDGEAADHTIDGDPAAVITRDEEPFNALAEKLWGEAWDAITGGEPPPKPDKQANPLWDRNDIQFPRLLAEVCAVGLSDAQVAALSESMDLNTADIDELFERAQAQWNGHVAQAVVGFTPEPAGMTDTERGSYYTVCPYCKSDDFLAGSFDCEGNQVWQKIRCNLCYSQWTEVYYLHHVEKGEGQ